MSSIASKGPAYATRVWWMLRAFGFDRAAILNGGLAKWTREGRPLTDAPPSHPPAEFKVRERPKLFVDKAHMVAALAAGDACIINALSKEQHTGSGDQTTAVLAAFPVPAACRP